MTRHLSTPDPTPDALLDLACAAALAGAELVRGRRADASGDVATKSTPTDVVTAVDTAAEREVVGRLLAARPDDGVLGEEGAAREGSSGVRWIVDPIDGTVNFLYGLPQYAVSVAAERDGEVVAGVVVNAATGETFTAVRGGGAFRGDPVTGARLGGSTRTDIAQALVATGFSYDSRIRADQAAVLARVLPAVRDIRRFGAAALDLCAAASGQVDAYFERELNPWDLAAGGLVAHEAGLRVEGLHGAAPGPAMTVAAPPALFDALHDLVAGSG